MGSGGFCLYDNSHINRIVVWIWYNYIWMYYNKAFGIFTFLSKATHRQSIQKCPQVSLIRDGWHLPVQKCNPVIQSTLNWTTDLLVRDVVDICVVLTSCMSWGEKSLYCAQYFIKLKYCFLPCHSRGKTPQTIIRSDFTILEETVCNCNAS